MGEKPGEVARAWALFTAVLGSRLSWNSSKVASRVPLPLCGSSRPGSPEQRPDSNSCWGFPADENESQTCLHIQRGLSTEYVGFFPGSLQQKAYVSGIVMTSLSSVMAFWPELQDILFCHLSTYEKERGKNMNISRRLSILFDLGLALSLPAFRIPLTQRGQQATLLLLVKTDPHQVPAYHVPR